MDNINEIFNRFLGERTAVLSQRFNGWYRAVVTETNDPLRMHRVRVKVPELHNHNLSSDKTPWAVPAPMMGGSGAGSWSAPIIGDTVFVAFEKNHPYSIIWTAAADATRRKFYAHQSIYGETPLPVNKSGIPTEKPDDFIKEYLPVDERPLSFGWRDRYGNFISVESVGYIPKEHRIDPAPTGTDGTARSNFASSKKQAIENEPDTKLIAIATKYGNYVVMGDQGYDWSKEFSGDFDDDEKFEIARSKYLRRLFNEDAPKGRDQRRYEVRTRYGHKFEMRDVGWIQTRPGEYNPEARIISQEEKRDERWIKLRSKGGHLLELSDIGFDPVDDLFVKRLLLAERGAETDDEEAFGDDARMIRFVTRYGFKLVLDDRCSDRIDAEGKETPRGNGFLVKGRRAGRGFGIEFNEKDQRNNMLLYTPKSKAFEMNDQFDYIMLATDMSGNISEPFVNKKDNEFALNMMMSFDPEKDTYHMKLDKRNGYARFKTPLRQGIEMRDGVSGPGKWFEARDSEDRGFLMSADRDLAAWRSKDKKKYIAIDEGKNLILIRTDEGKIQIFSNTVVEVIANSINMRAKTISMLAQQEICMSAGGGTFRVNSEGTQTNKTVRGATILGRLPGAMPGSGAQSPAGEQCQVAAPTAVRLTETELAPDVFDKERGFDPTKGDKGIIDKLIITCRVIPPIITPEGAPVITS